MTRSSPTRLALALLAALLAAGCGVKGQPELPGDKGDAFPAEYPQGAVAPEERPTNVFLERWRDRR
jgi:predicted small lipoprotein YifL